VPNLASFFIAGSGDIVNLDQSAVNAVNVISANELPDILGATDISQTASGFQLSTNIAATTASVSGVTQAATNVANSIGMPSDS
jgi:phosphoribosylcarboxyaminoimidazole (NCAIR) mutase